MKYSTTAQQQLMLRKKTVERSVFLRYIITNLLILLPPFIVAVVYFAVASSALSAAADATAELQLEGNVSYVDRKLSDLDKMIGQLVVDYRVNRYLNVASGLTAVEIYDRKQISDRLSAIILGGEFLDRCILYLSEGDQIIYESGFADYRDFYGPLLDVKGYDARSLRLLLLGGEGGKINLYPDFMVSSGSGFMQSHFLVRPVGYGDQRRGAFVAIVKAADLGRRLSRLPELYGGGIFVFDGDGNLLASSPTDPDRNLVAAASSPGTTKTLSIDMERYRQYRRVSSYNGWEYVALMNEKGITDSANRIRNIAFLLLGAGFLVAFLLSYGLASSNSKPIIRLFSLVNIPQDLPSPRTSTVYERVEEAILNLSDSNSRLEREVSSALSIARNYFFHNLLRGEYRDRQLFTEDRKKFMGTLSAGPYYVIEGRLPSLVATLEGTERNTMADTFFSAMTSALGSDEHGVFLSSGAMVLIKRASSTDEYRAESHRFIESVLASLDLDIRDGVVFGVGTPVSDPFLLSLSFGEAEAALASGNFALRSPIQLYESLPSPANTYRYPLDVESAVIKAVRSANTVLLESLVDGVYKDNFVERTLSVSEGHFLAAAFRGTALRLLSEFDEPMSGFPGLIDGVGKSDSSPKEDFREISLVLKAMAEEKRNGKKSHNVSLAAGIRDHISLHFRDFNLSLSSISEAFNLSENYLSSFFKEQEGECLCEYIQRKRMTEASSLLRETRESVDAIAANCGYTNGPSFRRAFKRMYGMSPSEFRTRNERS